MTAKVLLLNASYQPIRALGIKDAVDLIMREKVEPAWGTDYIDIQTPSKVFKLPTILRLQHMVNVPDRKATWSKWGVLRRDNYTCVYCGLHTGHRIGFTVDHIIPRIQGGRNSWGNTACACRPCNKRKGGRTPHQAGMPMRFEPKTPRTSYLIVSGQVPKEWKHYVKV